MLGQLAAFAAAAFIAGPSTTPRPAGRAPSVAAVQMSGSALIIQNKGGGHGESTDLPSLTFNLSARAYDHVPRI